MLHLQALMELQSLVQTVGAQRFYLVLDFGNGKIADLGDATLAPGFSSAPSPNSSHTPDSIVLGSHSNYTGTNTSLASTGIVTPTPRPIQLSRSNMGTDGSTGATMEARCGTGTGPGRGRGMEAGVGISSMMDRNMGGRNMGISSMAATPGAEMGAGIGAGKEPGKAISASSLLSSDICSGVQLESRVGSTRGVPSIDPSQAGPNTVTGLPSGSSLSTHDLHTPTAPVSTIPRETTHLAEQSMLSLMTPQANDDTIEFKQSLPDIVKDLTYRDRANAAMAIMRIADPNKDRAYPYRNGKGVPPPWWPEVAHISPTMMTREEQVQLLMGLLTSPSVSSTTLVGARDKLDSPSARAVLTRALRLR